jgi:hypothetical protein
MLSRSNCSNAAADLFFGQWRQDNPDLPKLNFNTVYLTKFRNDEKPQYMTTLDYLRKYIKIIGYESDSITSYNTGYLEDASDIKPYAQLQKENQCKGLPVK